MSAAREPIAPDGVAARFERCDRGDAVDHCRLVMEAMLSEDLETLELVKTRRPTWLTYTSVLVIVGSCLVVGKTHSAAVQFIIDCILAYDEVYQTKLWSIVFSMGFEGSQSTHTLPIYLDCYATPSVYRLPRHVLKFAFSISSEVFGVSRLAREYVELHKTEEDKCSLMIEIFEHAGQSKSLQRQRTLQVHIERHLDVLLDHPHLFEHLTLSCSNLEWRAVTDAFTARLDKMKTRRAKLAYVRSHVAPVFVPRLCAMNVGDVLDFAKLLSHCSIAADEIDTDLMGKALGLSIMFERSERLADVIRCYASIGASFRKSPQIIPSQLIGHHGRLMSCVDLHTLLVNGIFPAVDDTTYLDRFSTSCVTLFIVYWLYTIGEARTAPIVRQYVERHLRLRAPPNLNAFDALKLCNPAHRGNIEVSCASDFRALLRPRIHMARALWRNPFREIAIEYALALSTLDLPVHVGVAILHHFLPPMLKTYVPYGLLSELLARIKYHCAPQHELRRAPPTRTYFETLHIELHQPQTQ